MNKNTWEIKRPSDCQSCLGQGNTANTPRIILEVNGSEGAPKGSVACRWCGYEITAPTLNEAIAKWDRFQTIIRLGYGTVNEAKQETPTVGEQERFLAVRGYFAYLRNWMNSCAQGETASVYFGSSPKNFTEWYQKEGINNQLEVRPTINDAEWFNGENPKVIEEELKKKEENKNLLKTIKLHSIGEEDI